MNISIEINKERKSFPIAQVQRLRYVKNVIESDSTARSIHINQKNLFDMKDFENLLKCVPQEDKFVISTEIAPKDVPSLMKVSNYLHSLNTLIASI